MSNQKFRALIVNQQEGKTVHAFQELTTGALPEGDVVVRVDYSSLNYKDGLAITGKGRVVRRFPMVPGVDLAGVVEASESPDFKQGDRVLLTGWGVGEGHWGGYAQKARLKSKWLTHLPQELSPEQAMAIGTAGFTAMLCMIALEQRGLKTDGGQVVVTGAAGGVGSLAVALLANMGYEVTASSGRAELHDYLYSLGAHNVVDRAALARAAKPLESETWAGAVDTVGGQTLAAVLSQMRYGATVAACGLAGGMQLETTVFPFILRGVALQGIDSVMYPATQRPAIWARLARDLPMEKLATMTQTVGLSQLPEIAPAILKGQIRGRVVVDVNASS
ncbi:MAG: MDR family oxidoreductase [Acidiferrobacterales bacterium]